MILSDLSIRRPVLASMLSAALVLFGIIGYRQLSVREYPDVDPPIISVQTFLVGANPQVMESAVTDILEEELSTVPGLRTLVSSSGEQFSNITLEFTLDRDVDDAAQDVRDKVSRVRGRLPIDIEEPVIAKQEADASPFFWLALNGQNYSLLQLSDLADRLVKSQLQTVPGVGSVFIAGERRYAMRVWLSTAQLSARGLTVQNVEQAIRTRNVEVPAGRIESNRREFTVRSLGELKTPAEFGELVVASQGGQLVKLKDLGHVELGAEDERSALRFKGAPTVGLGVVRQSKANLITVADAVREALPRIAASLPPGVSLDVAYDGSTFVKRSILEAQETLVIAAILVVIIIFVFLRNVRSTIIPGLAIPVSIVSTFAVMYFLGFSINNLTLLALTLAIGIVVDDAIIVLENAFRHQGRAGRGCRDGGGERHARDRIRRDRHHHRAGRGVHATGLPQGQYRPPVQRIRHRRGGLRHRVRLRGAHPDADALCEDPPGAEGAWPGIPHVRKCLHQPHDWLRPVPSLGPRARLLHPGRGNRLGGARGRGVSWPEARIRPAGGSRPLHHLPDRTGGVHPRVHRPVPEAGRGDHRQDPGR
jgi:multidrug efflux pump subunit AcrB